MAEFAGLAAGGPQNVDLSGSKFLAPAICRLPKLSGLLRGAPIPYLRDPLDPPP